MRRLCGGWLETDNRAISVQLNFTGTATGTELGNMTWYMLYILKIKLIQGDPTELK